MAAEMSITTKSQAKVLGSAEMEWEIVGWHSLRGPLVRSLANCFINVGNDVCLRFHLGSFPSKSDPTLKFCNQSNSLISKFEKGCGECLGCTSAPVPQPETPFEHLPSTNVQCSGYSLLVDLVSTHDQVAFWIDAKMQNNDSVSNFVVLKPTDNKKNVVACPIFYRTATWTLDKEGEISNYTPNIVSDQVDAKFLLSVTLYQEDSSVVKKSSDNNTEEQDISNGMDTNGHREPVLRVTPNVDLIAKDGLCISAPAAALAHGSSYFKRCFERKPVPVAGFRLNTNGNVLHGIVNWINTGVISSESVPWLGEMCAAAKDFELHGFWDTLDQTLESFCARDNMHWLHELAEQYELNRAKAEIVEYINDNSISN